MSVALHLLGPLLWCSCRSPYTWQAPDPPRTAPYPEKVQKEQTFRNLAQQFLTMVTIWKDMRSETRRLRTKILWPGPEETRKRKEASTEIIGKNTSWSQSLQGFCTSKRRLALGFLNHQQYQTWKTTQGNQLHGWHQQQSGAFSNTPEFSSQKGVQSWKRLYGQRHFSPFSWDFCRLKKKIIKNLAFQMSSWVTHAFWKVWQYSLRMVFSPIIRLRKGIQESV